MTITFLRFEVAIAKLEAEKILAVKEFPVITSVHQVLKLTSYLDIFKRLVRYMQKNCRKKKTENSQLTTKESCTIFKDNLYTRSVFVFYDPAGYTKKLRKTIVVYYSYQTHRVEERNTVPMS